MIRWELDREISTITAMKNHAIGRILQDSKKNISSESLIRYFSVFLGLIIIFLELVAGTFHDSSIQEITQQLVPLAPLFLILVGNRSAMLGWIFSWFGLAIFAPDVYGAQIFLLLSTIIISGTLTLLLPHKKAIATTSIFLVCIVGTGLFFPVFSSGILVLSFTGSAIAAFIGIMLNRFRTRHKETQKTLLETQKFQENIRREERIRLAHELHDIVAHEVTVIAMQARRAKFSNNDQQILDILNGIGDSAQQALQDLRSLVSILKDTEKSNSAENSDPPPVTDLLQIGELSGETTVSISLIHDLENILESLKRSGIDARLEIEGKVARIPPAIRQALRRTARELGTNILKHADSTQPVTLSLSVDNSGLSLVSSNAISHQKPLVSSQTGLEAMKTRFHSLGGSVTVEETEKLWKIKIFVPLPS